MIYICERCGKKFIDKFIYMNHLKRKTPCSKEDREKLENKNYECDLCNKRFINKQTLIRHKEKYCKGYNEEIEKMIENKESFEKALNDLNTTSLIKKNSNDLIEEKNNKILYKNKIIMNKLTELNEKKNLKVEKNQISEPIYNKNTTIQNEIKKVNGFIYILKEREFIKTNEDIYKIGKTSQKDVIDRIKQYPKNSLLYGYWIISDIDEFEKLLKSSFRIKFKNKKEIGTEYYEGNIDEMIIHIEKLFNLHY
jgi:hypothetical protein